MRKLFILLLSIISTVSCAQEIVLDLNGFRLGQFRSVPENELKTVLQQDKFEDGFEYEIYLFEPDTSVYMIFEYADYDLQTIWSIQVTGSKQRFDCSFKGLKLGMSVKEIISIMGKPSSIEDAGEYGKKWIYGNTNYTLEVTPNGDLGGIKIIDMSFDFFPEPDLKKIPSFDDYTEILKSKNRKTISELLAPSIEIYKNDSVYLFVKSIDTEVKNDNSGVFNLIDEMSTIISNINPKDTLQYEENVRLALGNSPMHVAKFNVKKKYHEIVFKYMFGRYLIWEMKIN
jgi:hypothetical protein